MMKYTAHIAEKGYSIAVADETGKDVGWLTEFDEREIASDFLRLIYGKEALESCGCLRADDLEVHSSLEIDMEGIQSRYVKITDGDYVVCYVDGLDYEDAPKFGEALVKQIKEYQEPEPTTKDEFLQQLREAWDDVQNHRTHILHDFTDFFKDELGEE